MTNYFVAPTGFVLKDSNGLVVDHNSIWLDTVDKSWEYSANEKLGSMFFYGSYKSAERHLEKLNKMNELAEFDMTFHIEEFDNEKNKGESESIPIGKPLHKGTITRLKKQVREIEKAYQ